MAFQPHPAAEAQPRVGGKCVLPHSDIQALARLETLLLTGPHIVVFISRVPLTSLSLLGRRLLSA